MKRIGIRGTIIPNDYKDIYDYFGIESTCPADVIKGISEAQGDEITFEINSGGGAIFAGSEIYNAIRSHPGNKKIEIVGFAGSAASVIACAAHSSIAPTGMLMVHNVSGYVGFGNHSTFEHEAQTLRECDKAIAAAYVQKTGMSQEEVLQLMDEETWINAENAVSMGFVDEITQTPGLYNGFCEILSSEQIAKAREALSGKAVEEEKINLLKLEVKHD